LYAATANPDNPIRVYVNNQQVNFEGQDPIMSYGRVLVPVRGVFDLMGFEITPDNEARTATITGSGITIIIPFDGNYFTVNGERVTPDVPQMLANDRLLLPLRAIAEALGGTPAWDRTTRTATITTTSVLDYQPGDETPPTDPQDDPQPPPHAHFLRRWQQPQYINADPRYTPSNQHLANDIQDLHNDTLNATTNAFPWDLWGNWLPQSLPTFSPQCEEFDALLRQALQTGFAYEAMRTVFPFNELYWDSLTDAITYHVWRLQSNEPAAAIWAMPMGLEHGMHIFMGTEQTQRAYPHDMLFAHLTFHEIANIFGLNDPLAELLAEDLTGRRIVWQCCLRHDSTFARILYEHVNDPVAFWRGAFSANSYMAAFWDAHFGEIIPAHMLQMALGVDYVLKAAPDLQLQFYHDTGIDQQTRLSIASLFLRGNDQSLLQSQQDQYLMQAAYIITLTYEWGVANNITPYPFVNDTRIQWRERMMS